MDNNNQFVVFRIEGEDFGVEINYVREIIKPQQILKVPNSPKYVEGMINLRSKVQPIVSLRRKFHFPDRDFDERTKIIIVNVGEMSVGFIVDDVSEILRIDDQNMEVPPEIITGHHRKYIRDVGKIGDRMVIILDLNLILSEEEERQLREIVKLRPPHLDKGEKFERAEAAVPEKKIEQPVRVEQPVIVEKPVEMEKVEVAAPIKIEEKVEAPVAEVKIETPIVEEKAEKPVVVEKVEKPVVVEKVEKPVVVEKAEKPVVVEKVEKPAVVEKVEKSAKVEKTEKRERGQNPAKGRK